MKYRSYILISQSVLCHRVFSGFLSLLPLFPFFFHALAYFRPLCVFYNLLTVLRGCFTPIGLIHLSQSLALLSSLFLSFSPLSFLFSSFLFLSSLLFPFSLALSLQIFGVRPPPCRTASDGPVHRGFAFQWTIHFASVTVSVGLHRLCFVIFVAFQCTLFCAQLVAMYNFLVLLELNVAVHTSHILTFFFFFFLLSFLYVLCTFTQLFCGAHEVRGGNSFIQSPIPIQSDIQRHVTITWVHALREKICLTVQML